MIYRQNYETETDAKVDVSSIIISSLYLFLLPMHFYVIVDVMTWAICNKKLLEFEGWS